MTQSLSMPEESGIFPATPAQQRFWYLNQVSPDSAASNIAVQWELRGEIRHENVQTAFEIIIGRHEALRTSLIEIDGQSFQRVSDTTDFRLGVLDVRSLPKTEREARIDRIAEELASEPFDLTEPSLLRAALVPFDDQRAMLLIAVHHAVFDGFSIGVLGRELGQIVAALETDSEPNLPPLDLQYGDYALWQQACAESDDRARSGQYWRDALADMSYFEVQPDHQHKPAPTRRGARHTTALPTNFGDQLKDLSSQLEASAFAIGAGVTAATLHGFTGNRDISFGTTFAGRGEPEIDPLIGVFINPVVLRFGVDPSDTLRSVVRGAHSTVTQATTHSYFPFDVLARDLKCTRDPDRTPLVSVFFGLQNAFLEEKTYGPLQMVSVPSHTPEIAHDIDILFIGRATGWHLIIDYDADLFEAATIATLSNALIATLDGLQSNTDMQIADIPMPSRGNLPDAPTSAFEARLNETINGVSEIWSDVLGVATAQRNGDFFELGGHSLLSLRMLSRVQDRFGVRPRYCPISDRAHQARLG